MDKQGFARLVKHLFDAWQEGNAEAAATYFMPNAIYAELPEGRINMGTEEIRLYFEETARKERNPSYILHKTIFCDGEGVVEWTWMFNSATSGELEVYRGVALVEIEGDKFSSWREYEQRLQRTQAA